MSPWVSGGSTPSMLLTPSKLELVEGALAVPRELCWTGSRADGAGLPARLGRVFAGRASRRGPPAWSGRVGRSRSGALVSVRGAKRTTGGGPAGGGRSRGAPRGGVGRAGA